MEVASSTARDCVNGRDKPDMTAARLDQEFEVPASCKSYHSSLLLSASDLVGHLHCRHLTALDVAVAGGTLAKPEAWDPFQEILQERGDGMKRTISST